MLQPCESDVVMVAAAGELGGGGRGAPLRLGGRHRQGRQAVLYKVSLWTVLSIYLYLENANTLKCLISIF